MSPASLKSSKSGATSPSRSKKTTSRAVGIVRVSHVGGRTGDSFVSPSEQAERIRLECGRRGLKLIDTFKELDVSGGAAIDQRPGLTKALKLVEDGKADVIVVAYFDRLVRGLSRQTEILERVEKAGGSVLTVDLGEVRTDTASAWLTSTAHGMMAEYVRRMSGERAHEGKQRAIDRGVPPFPNIPFFVRLRDDGTLERHPKEWKIAAKAVQLRAAGKPLREVRDYLWDRGIEMSYHGVQQLLRSRLLIGELHFGNFEPNRKAVEPIIDRRTWTKAQRVSVPRGRRAKSDRLLARLGVLRCGTCGSRMVVGTSNNGGYGMYRCPPVGDCPRRVTISADRVEDVVVEEVQELLEGISETATIDHNAEAADLEAERAEQELDAAIRAFSGLDDVEAARERLQELRDVTDQARDRADELRAAVAPAINVSAKDWDRLALDEQRALIVAVIDEVTVAPGRGAERIKIKSK